MSDNSMLAKQKVMSEYHAKILHNLYVMWNSLDVDGCPFADELDSFNCKFREWAREKFKEENNG